MNSDKNSDRVCKIYFFSLFSFFLFFPLPVSQFPKLRVTSFLPPRRTGGDVRAMTEGLTARLSAGNEEIQQFMFYRPSRRARCPITYFHARDQIRCSRAREGNICYSDSERETLIRTVGQSLIRTAKETLIRKVKQTLLFGQRSKLFYSDSEKKNIFNSDNPGVAHIRSWCLSVRRSFGLSRPAFTSGFALSGSQ